MLEFRLLCYFPGVPPGRGDTEMSGPAVRCPSFRISGIGTAGGTLVTLSNP
jgi:hypothetical protein